MKLSLASISAYKRADAHLTKRTSHGAIGTSSLVLVRGLGADAYHLLLTSNSCTRSFGHARAVLVQQRLQLIHQPITLSGCCVRGVFVAAVTVLGVLLGITLATHETRWYWSGKATSKVSVAVQYNQQRYVDAKATMQLILPWMLLQWSRHAFYGSVDGLLAPASAKSQQTPSCRTHVWVTCI